MIQRNTTSRGAVIFRASEACLNRTNLMSVEIAAALREEANKAREVRERLSNPADKKVLAQMAARLVEIAERLERDARD